MENKQKDPVLEAFQTLKETSVPEPVAQRRMQANFIQQIQQVREETVTFSRKSRLNQQRNQKNNLIYRWRTSSMTVKIIGAIVALATLLGGAGAGTVYAAQTALPDDALYDVKVWSEDVRLDLAQSPEEDLALHLDFADRRIEEMFALLDEGKPLDVELKLELIQHLWLAEQLIGDCEDPILAQDQVRDRLKLQDQLLMDAPEDALLTQTRDMLQQRIHLMDCDTEECRQQVCQDGDCLTGDQDMVQDQIRDQLRIDQPEGAGSETGNGYTGEYPEPQQGQNEDPGTGQGAENQPDGAGDGGQNAGNGSGQEKTPEPAENQQSGDGNGNGGGNGK